MPIRQSGMRDYEDPVKKTLSLLESGEDLPDDDPRTRNGGLSPSRRQDMQQIQMYMQLRQNGSLSDQAWEKLIKRNPHSATLFSSVQGPVRGPDYSQYFQPEQPGTPGTPAQPFIPPDAGAFPESDQQLQEAMRSKTPGQFGLLSREATPDIPGTPGREDPQNAIRAALGSGDLDAAKTINQLYGEKQSGSDAKLSTTILAALATGVKVKGFEYISKKEAQDALDKVLSQTNFEQVLPDGSKVRVIAPRSQYPQGVSVQTDQSTNKKLIDTQRGAREVLTKANDLVDRIWTAEDFRGGLAQAARFKAKELAGNDPDVASYHSLREGFMAPLIRALGEKGTLAEGDVGRARNLWPSYNDTKPVAKAKLKQIEDIFNGIVSDKYTNLNQAITAVAPANTPGGSAKPRVKYSDLPK